MGSGSRKTIGRARGRKKVGERASEMRSRDVSIDRRARARESPLAFLLDRSLKARAAEAMSARRLHGIAKAEKTDRTLETLFEWRIEVGVVSLTVSGGGGGGGHDISIE